MKKFLTAVVGVGVLAGSTLIGAGSASAAVRTGADPLAAGCSSDAYTAASWSAYDYDGYYQARVELRYSPKCGTNWIRVFQERAAYGMAASIRLDNGAYGDGYGGGYASWWTGMVYAPGSTCVNISVGGGGTINPASAPLNFPAKRICG